MKHAIGILLLLFILLPTQLYAEPTEALDTTELAGMVTAAYGTKHDTAKACINNVRMPGEIPADVQFMLIAVSIFGETPGLGCQRSGPGTVKAIIWR